VRVSSIGITKTPTVEFASWIIMAGAVLVHLWFVGRKPLRASAIIVEECLGEHG
jgi:hypothetical protein